MKQIIHNIFFIFYISALILITNETVNSEIIMIVNKNVRMDTIEPSSIANIYFGNKTKWPDGQTIHVVMLKKGKTHDLFVNKILRSTPSKLKSYWKKVVFTGIGIRPRIFRNEADVVKYISTTKGTIGYIDDSVSHDIVKVIKIKQ